MYRRMDSLGRLTLPRKFMDDLAYAPYQPVEIIMEYGKIAIRKFEENEVNVARLPKFGIVRKLDVVNRVVIPKEYFYFLGIRSGERQLLNVDLIGNVIYISKEE
ncbi:MAG: hypothetical protein E7311_06760 [Clostridiales bacterium]|nr:hypothetical protein [Clostridiales bacterium]